MYYVSGFDPRGAGFYHRLYREESAKQSVHLGTTVEVGARSRLDKHVSAWNVSSQWHGNEVSTEYQFLHWDDLVRRHWEPNLLKLLLSSLATYAGYVGCGAFGRLVLRPAQSEFGEGRLSRERLGRFSEHLRNQRETQRT
ncbi:hypothetical protein [Cupriavidus necator]